MAPAAAQTLLSPAELSYLHSSLSLDPPIRPDGRAPATFRPLIAEIDILPSTYGSARICFADGTESIVGVKAEVQRTERDESILGSDPQDEADEVDVEMSEAGGQPTILGKQGKGQRTWVEMSIEIPGFRDDDALPIFLASLLNEALLANLELADKLYINERFHWKLYIDVLLISPPLSYPVPLLSLTIHLALLTTSLPALVSVGEEDPLFNDDWDAATPLYPPSSTALPPITLLVASVGHNLIFDPSKEELAVADGIVAISLAKSHHGKAGDHLRLLAVRTIDPLSRLTTAGVPDSENTAASVNEEKVTAKVTMPKDKHEGVWRPPQGGMKRDLIPRAVAMCIGPKGVASEVLQGLTAFRAKS